MLATFITKQKYQEKCKTFQKLNSHTYVLKIGKQKKLLNFEIYVNSEFLLIKLLQKEITY